MQSYYVVTEFTGGLCTIKFDGREGVLVFEDWVLANAYMSWVFKEKHTTAAIIKFEDVDRNSLTEKLLLLLSEEERRRIELLFPDRVEYWPLVKQLL